MSQSPFNSSHYLTSDLALVTTLSLKFPIEEIVRSNPRKAVFVFRQILINAPVSAIHYSKNIPLTDGSTPYSFVKHISQTNITTRLDTNQTDYRNEGHSYKLHANSYEVSFYDKIKDLQIAKSKGLKRAVDRDSAIQLSLFDQFTKRDFFEVLRMKVRLNRRQKMRPLFKQLGIETELTFQHLFSSQIAQKVLLHYLEYVEQRTALLDFKPKNNKNLVAQIMIHDPELKPRKILQLVGLKTVMDSMGMREVRSVFGNRLSQSTWYNLIRETKRYFPTNTAQSICTTSHPPRTI